MGYHRLRFMGFEVSAAGKNAKRNFRRLILLGIVLLPIVFVGVGFLVKYLWTFTIADLLGAKEMTFWQAWGLILLCWILFKANVSGSESDHNPHRGTVG